MLMVVEKGVILSSCARERRCALFCFVYTCFRVFLIWFKCGLRVARSGLLLFSFVLEVTVFLRAWMSVRSVFVSGVGFVRLCPSGCFGVPGGVWRGRVCRG